MTGDHRPHAYIAGELTTKPDSSSREREDGATPGSQATRPATDITTSAASTRLQAVSSVHAERTPQLAEVKPLRNR